MQYVLIHGAWQGGWCWESIASLLNQEGHGVSCIDLPGHGNNTFPLSKVTYDVYYQSLVKELLQYQEPVVLVAHSMSGMLAAPLLDQYSERIAHLFLIAAFVPQDGRSLLDLALAGGPSAIPSILQTDAKNRTQSLNLLKAKEALYHDCPSAIADWAIARLQAQPMAPLTHAINWKDSGKTAYKRTYIFCEDDRDVHPITQQNILNQYPCKIIKFKSGHFPFLSQPERLVSILTVG